MDNNILNEEQSQKIQIQDHYVQFVSWLKENGAIFNQIKYPVVFGESLVGAAAAQDTDQNTPIFMIPNKLLISPLMIERTELSQILKENPKLFCENHSGDAEFNILALFLLYERIKGEKSFYHPYLQMMQNVEAICEWSDPNGKHIRELQDQCLEAEIYEFLTDFDNLWKKFQNLLLKYQFLFPVGSYDKKMFQWAQQCVMTRCYGHSLPSTFLIPLADGLNHNAKVYTTHYLIHRQREMVQYLQADSRKKDTDEELEPEQGYLIKGDKFNLLNILSQSRESTEEQSNFQQMLKCKSIKPLCNPDSKYPCYLNKKKTLIQSYIKYNSISMSVQDNASNNKENRMKSLEQMSINQKENIQAKRAYLEKICDSTTTNEQLRKITNEICFISLKENKDQSIWNVNCAETSDSEDNDSEDEDGEEGEEEEDDEEEDDEEEEDEKLEENENLEVSNQNILNEELAKLEIENSEFDKNISEMKKTQDQSQSTAISFGDDKNQNQNQSIDYKQCQQLHASSSSMDPERHREIQEELIKLKNICENEKETALTLNQKNNNALQLQSTTGLDQLEEEILVINTILSNPDISLQKLQQQTQKLKLLQKENFNVEANSNSNQTYTNNKQIKGQHKLQQKLQKQSNEEIQYQSLNNSTISKAESFSDSNDWAWYDPMDQEVFFVQKTRQPVAKDQQLYNCYGRRSNRFLLLWYGFVFEDNCYDSYQFRLINPHDRVSYMQDHPMTWICQQYITAKTWKQGYLVNQNQIKIDLKHVSKQFRLKERRIDLQFLKYLRCVLRGYYQGDEWEALDYSQPKSIKYELFIMEFAIKILFELLKQFGTTYAQDQVTLQQLRIKERDSGENNFKHQFAVTYRMSNKRILQSNVIMCQTISMLLVQLQNGNLSLNETVLQMAGKSTHIFSNCLKVKQYIKSLYDGIPFLFAKGNAHLIELQNEMKLKYLNQVL